MSHAAVAAFKGSVPTSAAWTCGAGCGEALFYRLGELGRTS
eukprot:CAMPEP_0114134402 /NCGR_PEP_ID=MMETSP0043_2-20121206/14134_1 /TAXON_ID=464988 /ORGANISM="Hemiselmis andersenii, Strain CCMP644" /LENGTH=40 /DNA_ID= /DNA_START= /DNA_END= /DNA_ORIENTATION=